MCHAEVSWGGPEWKAGSEVIVSGSEWPKDYGGGQIWGEARDEGEGCGQGTGAWSHLLPSGK